MWTDVSCPRCSFGRRINGIGRCGGCGAILIYRPSARRKTLDIRGRIAFMWSPDDAGDAYVHPDDGKKISQERGVWIRCQGDTVTFDHPDRRRTARPTYSWERTGTRFEKDA